MMRYWDDLFQVAYKRTRHAEDARDIIRDLFISFWNNIGNVDIEENLGAYLFTALRNKILNYFEKRTIRLDYLLSQIFQPVESEEVIFATIRTKEIRECVAAVVGAMPPRMREIYILSKEQQITIADIAALLQISSQTVKNQLHTALERIRGELKKQRLTQFVFFSW